MNLLCRSAGVTVVSYLLITLITAMGCNPVVSQVSIHSAKTSVVESRPRIALTEDASIRYALAFLFRNGLIEQPVEINRVIEHADGWQIEFGPGFFVDPNGHSWGFDIHWMLRVDVDSHGHCSKVICDPLPESIVKDVRGDEKNFHSSYAPPIMQAEAFAQRTGLLPSRTIARTVTFGDSESLVFITPGVYYLENNQYRTSGKAANYLVRVNEDGRCELFGVKIFAGK